METMTDKDIRTKAVYYVLGGAIIGALIFLALYGVAPIVPTNVQYLYDIEDQDVPSHQLGFDFFRNQPWTMPPGENRLYPYRYTSSVFFSNSLPLFALFFKLFDSILPQYFQYFGIWSVLCYILQGIFAALILYKMKIKLLPALLSVPFFVCNVPLLFRTFHHIELEGQWLILAAFFLVLCQKDYSVVKKTLLWCMLIFISVLVHAYLFVMVGFIMTISLIREAINGKKYMQHFIVFISAVLCFLFGFYIEGGFIPVDSVTKKGFEECSFAITDLFDFSLASSLLSNGENVYNSGEQASYLGLGVILLLVICVCLLIFRRKNIKLKLSPEAKVDLVLISIGGIILFLISLSPRIRYMQYVLLDLTPYIPESLLRGLSMFRASARFFMPVWYLMLIVLAVAINRLCEGQKKLIVFLMIALIIQLVDIIPQNTRGVDQNITHGYNDVLCESFDKVFNDKAVHVAYMGQFLYRMTAPAVFASHHDMSYNASNVARGHKSSIAEDIEDWNAGKLKNDTVYIIPWRSAFCIEPVELPHGFVCYLCDEYFVVFDESISKAEPTENALYISAESLQEIIAYIYNE